MAKEQTTKTESSLEAFHPAGWMSPIQRMEEMMDAFFRRPFGLREWPHMSRMMGEIEPSPSVDIFEEGDNIILKSEMPGMSKEDVEITLTDDTITISGEKKKEEKVERKDYFRFERSFGSFRRTFALPADVQSDKAKATFKNGVLKVKIPKSAVGKKKEKKIKIE